MAESKIEWTDAVWNPVRGCSRVSPGCDACYAMGQARRFDVPGGAYEGLTRIGKRGVDWSGVVRLVPEALEIPLGWRKPRKVFVNSMSDLFHESLSDEAIADVFGVMAVCGGRDLSWCAQSEAGGGGAFHGQGDGYEPCGKWTDSQGTTHQMKMPRYRSGPHTFQVLTKRAERMQRTVSSSSFRKLVERAAYKWAHDRTDAGGLADAIENGDAWPLRNVWLGVSVENRKHGVPRIGLLRSVPAAVRFLSIEPQLEDVGELDLTGIHWVIVGGESGNGARPFDIGWARSIVDQCRAAAVPCFVKQLGARPFERGVGLLDDDCPDAVDVVRVALKNRKGGDVTEFPDDLRVREFPR